MSTVAPKPNYSPAVATVRRVEHLVAVHGGDLLVGVLVATTVLERVVLGRPSWLTTLAATWGLPLLARRRLPLLAPLTTLVLIAATTFAAPMVSGGTGGELLLMLTAVWMIAAHNPPRRLVWALLAVGSMVWSLGDDWTSLIMVAVLIAGAAIAGSVYRRDQAETVALHDQIEALESSRDAALQRAAADERARIARELHDIVAHSVSVMTVQAGAARMQLAHHPGQALASVVAVEQSTATALEELDRLVDLLGDEQRTRRGLDDVTRLVAGMREAGLDVRLKVEGAPRPLAGGLDLALYRVLQEALTNARKHAGPVATDVQVAYGSEEVRVRVVNELPPGAAAATIPRDGPGHILVDGTGHGLIGMRERVATYGGHLEIMAGHGRFFIDARVPYP